MKKTFLILFSIAVFYIITGNTFTNIKIPSEAIRVRVIANSDDNYDQKLKNQVKDDLSNYLFDILKDINKIEEARAIINNNMVGISSNINGTLHSFGNGIKYSINFGLNYFPPKKYKGISYDEGYYESLVVTLGEGKGSNFWCVLFPPLCLLEAEENNEVQYTSLVRELIDKYF